ncbi:bifunctional phosphopantothenoylcysteine decarboxylase/phosphopantothenate--cysteine ligase CoaBC, partial [Aliarcobacter butzleri]|nr:bifunctional phosphopantothenoylcysteine decarboxylase/phosphopantothenate--cysteine ligase CoaBC [Aliarcobacter butzleri]
LIKVQSSFEMYESLVSSLEIAKKESQKQSFLFMVAAVSDYLPTFTQEGKLKKDLIGINWNLELKQNIDILNSLDKSEIISIGFKAEMDELIAQNSAISMLEKKNLDAVCLNILNEENSFGSENNSIELILRNKHKSSTFKGSKLDISLEILEKLQDEFK